MLWVSAFVSRSPSSIRRSECQRSSSTRCLAFYELRPWAVVNVEPSLLASRSCTVGRILGLASKPYRGRLGAELAADTTCFFLASISHTNCHKHSMRCLRGDTINFPFCWIQGVSDCSFTRNYRRGTALPSKSTIYFTVGPIYTTWPHSQR